MCFCCKITDNVLQNCYNVFTLTLKSRYILLQSLLRSVILYRNQKWTISSTTILSFSDTFGMPS